jgi:hypothetical protein
MASFTGTVTLCSNATKNPRRRILGGGEEEEEEERKKFEHPRHFPRQLPSSFSK